MRYTVLLLASLLFLSAFGTLDTDGDGLLDSEEDRNGNRIADEGETDYLNVDTDNGGESDGTEMRAGRDPLDPRDDFTFDRDNDGLTNAEEASLGTNPDVDDSDEDGVTDSWDPFPLDYKYRTDADADGMPDEYEADHNFSSRNPDDALLDDDNDGINNRDEFILGTDPHDADTDDDGVDDGKELDDGSDPEENACLQFGGGSEYFADMEEHWAKQYVFLLHQTRANGQRIANGYQEVDRTVFLPDRPITRFELLKIALLASCTVLQDDTAESGITFSDVPPDPRPHESDDRRQRRQILYTAVQKGIVQGYDDGTFRPDDQVNRAEALKILLRSAQPEILDHPFLNLPDFPDATNEDWFGKYAKLASANDIISGYPDGTFGPSNPMTRAEASKIVLLLMVTNHRVNGYVVPVEDFFTRGTASPETPQ